MLNEKQKEILNDIQNRFKTLLVVVLLFPTIMSYSPGRQFETFVEFFLPIALYVTSYFFFELSKNNLSEKNLIYINRIILGSFIPYIFLIFTITLQPNGVVVIGSFQHILFAVAFGISVLIPILLSLFCVYKIINSISRG
ncbi:MAG: hypothetical protein Athens071416_90 [Parcubacteria group bacterium Athens0714_16]|nr:MAG: hypothetical protein Athens071416_90 [Parcubacteria group bacterium Athens0714_16]